MNPWAPTRLYTVDEVVDIMKSVGMTFREANADVYGTPASKNSIQMMTFSQKKV